MSEQTGGKREELTPERTERPRRRRRRRRRRTSGAALLGTLLVGFLLGAVSTCLLFQIDAPAKLRETFAARTVQADASAAEEPEDGEISADPADMSVQEDTGADAEQSAEEPPSDHERAAALAAEMTLEEKVYQLFVVTQEQLTGFSGTVTQSGETSKSAVKDKPVGGIVYFEQNLQTPEQVSAMISGIQSASKTGLFIAVDEEGGRVARLGNNSAMNTTSFPSMLELGKQGGDAVEEATKTIGSEIGAYGFNLDFAPVADVYTNSENTVIGDRALSTDPETAAELVTRAVQGFRESGMLCTLKHFPGHGDTSGDSHTDAVSVASTLDELREREFLPFKAGIEAGAEVVMIGHISTPTVTGNDMPATLSYQMVTEILRGELGFDGLVITDAMNMSAITSLYDSSDAAVKAIQAGVDLILMPANFDSAYQGVLSAVKSGELTEERINESVIRILETKLQSGIITAE